MEDNHSLYIEGVSEPHTWEPTDKYRETYEHPLWKDYQAKGVRGGHDGMDYLVFRAFVESVKNGHRQCPSTSTTRRPGWPSPA